MENSELARSWSSKNVIDYYLKHRDSIDDIYESEKHFLGDALKDGKSILDIGCAAGGFSKVVKAYNRDIEYIGIDISQAMIDEARKRFPDSNFHVCDGEKIDFRDEPFDICISFGVLHMTEKWERLLQEAWRVCRKSFIFDLRLVEKGGVSDPNESYQKLAFDGVWDGISKAPYLILNIDDAIRAIYNLEPDAHSVKAYGYSHLISDTVVSKYNSVCMSVFSLAKIGPFQPIDWQLPLKISDRLRQNMIG